MKQRQGADGTINQGIPSKDDFLTGEELQGTGPAQPPIPPQNTQQQNIPDLENMEGNPTVQRRMEINQMVDQSIANKVTTIEDQIQKDIERAQNKKFEGSPKHPKDVLKQLISKGEYVKDFQLFGHTWTLRALDQGDSLMSLDEVKDTIATASGRVMAMMFGTIVFSVQAIDGMPIYEWFDELKVTDFKDRMEYHIAVRRAFKKYLEAMPPSIVEMLYEKYLELDEERNNGLDELKNS